MRRTSSFVLAAVMTLSLAGCGDSSADAGPDTPESSAGEGATTEPSASDEPSDEPGVAPATGPEVRVDGLRLRLPRGFETRRPYDGMMTSDGPDLVRITVMTSAAMQELPLEEQAELAQQSDVWDKPPRRLDDVVVDEVPMFHLVGEGFAGYTDDRFGAQVGGSDVTLLFASFGSPEERAQVYESVLATVEWE